MSTLAPWKEPETQAVIGFSNYKKFKYFKNKFCSSFESMWGSVLSCNFYCKKQDEQVNCDIKKWSETGPLAKHSPISSLLPGFSPCNEDLECSSNQCLCVPHGLNDSFIGRCRSTSTDQDVIDMFKFVCKYGKTTELADHYEDISCAYYIYSLIGGLVKQIGSIQAGHQLDCLLGYTDYSLLIRIQQLIQQLHQQMLLLDQQVNIDKEKLIGDFVQIFNFPYEVFIILLIVALVFYKCCPRILKRNDLTIRLMQLSGEQRSNNV